MSSLTPLANFADLRYLLRQLPAIDGNAVAAARAREAVLLKPAGALGRLEQIASWLAGWQGRHPPRIEHTAIFVFAGNHGVADQGVSAYPATVTAAMVESFEAGGAAINQLARIAGAELHVVPLRLDRPTHDFTLQPAMDEAACVAALNTGLTAPDDALDVLAVGEMGIGNTTVAAALATALFAEAGEHPDPAQWVGAGTGVDATGMAQKSAVISRALARHEAVLGDPLEVLRHFGGFELAAILGAIVAGRLRRTPVVLDGFVATAAAAVLQRLRPDALDHCLAGHVSAERGHRRLLAELGLRPLLDLDLRLGEGTGAALALGLLRAAAACHSGMATFAEAGVAASPNKGA
ncbi:MAG TPA: nicotinate-nucleotide--dimethylbenzimidazole phosphoribosyltransferase [Geminicoccaceae bacterium]|nr:nicotinate-nucleotide--dimethylbenzimidazole phosphoribosyltransferase [Geminicoccaceae bacterium]HRY22802.1 nicotinate-nucleotide--dimethylbenzimidazole phosphoribosyltransferase [Geminicoccaceae bacterium]